MARRRKPGDGSIHLRKDGRWEGRCVVDYDVNGYPKTKNVLAKTKTECVEKLKKLKESIAKPKPDNLKPDMPFGEWLDYWYRNICKPTVRPKTQESHEERIYLHIIPEIGEIPLNEISREDLQRFYAKLKQSGRLLRTERYGEGLSDRTVHGCHTTCRLALQQAVKEGLIKTNPAVNCKLPLSTPKEMQVLTPEEMRRLLIQAREEGYYELILLELATGLRRGELVALQWDDLDFKTGALHVRRQVQRIKGELVVSQLKTKASDRIVILPQPVLNVLQEYRQQNDARWLFPSPKKEDAPLDPTAVRKKLSVLLDHAGCKKVRFHDLRHTFATTALENGMDVKTLSTIIGHVSSATTLNVYAHITDEMRKSAALKIDRGIAKAEPQETETAAAPKSQSRLPSSRIKANGGSPARAVSAKSEKPSGRANTPRGPDGKKRNGNVYAHSREECEEKLKELIVQMKTAITSEKERLKAQKQAG